MEWRALPSVYWWIVTGGMLWCIFWVTVVSMVSASLAWVFLHLTDGSGGLEAGPLQLAEKRHACGEISQGELWEIRRDLGARSAPIKQGRDGRRAVSMRS